jgi:hypothetical protein
MTLGPIDFSENYFLVVTLGPIDFSENYFLVVLFLDPIGSKDDLLLFFYDVMSCCDLGPSSVSLCPSIILLERTT